MWAYAQRDGRPAEYRWHPLRKFGNSILCTTPQSLADAHCQDAKAVKICWGAPNSRTEPLVGRRSPYCEDMWKRHCGLTSFFLIVDTRLSCEDIARQICAMVCRRRIFGDFLPPAFPGSRVQHISNLHSKFALRPHHVYGRHPICDR